MGRTATRLSPVLYKSLLRLGRKLDADPMAKSLLVAQACLYASALAYRACWHVCKLPHDACLHTYPPSCELVPC